MNINNATTINIKNEDVFRKSEKEKREGKDERKKTEEDKEEKGQGSEIKQVQSKEGGLIDLNASEYDQYAMATRGMTNCS